MIDKEKLEKLQKEAVEAVAAFRDIKEKQSVSEEGMQKLTNDLVEATKKYDEALAEQKEAIATAEQEAKASQERAADLEKKFSMLKDKGIDNVVDKKEDKKLMEALIKGKEHLSDYLDREEGVKAFDKYLKTVAQVDTEGVSLPGMSSFKQAAQRISTKSADTPSMRTDINLQGGVLLTPEQSNEILRKAVEKTPIEQYAKVVTISGKSIQQPVHEQIPRAYFQGELQSNTNSIPKYSMLEFTPHRQSVSIPVSLEMLTQPEYDIVAEINSNISQAQAVGMGYNSVKGTGVGMPEGFTINGDVAVDESAGTIDGDDILGLIYKLPSIYTPMFFMSRLTLGKIRLLKDSNDRYLWTPGGSIAEGAQPSIGGIPYVDTFIDMDTLSTTANTEPVLIADMPEFYQVTKNSNIFMQRDDNSKASEAQVVFHAHRWITGNVRNPEAGRILRYTSS